MRSGMLLTLSKRILESDRALRRDRNVNRNALIGNEAKGKTIGVVGIGNVGRRIAELCKGLLHMNVIAYDPNLGKEEIAARGAEKVELDDLLRRSDFVSISCPLDNGSRGMIGAKQFALMQPHAFFITTARGFIHDERALYDALKEKRIAGAGLDVWDKEPPPPEHPLLQFDNVLASPHTAGVTKEARVNMGRIAAEQLLDALDGKRPPRIINPEVWPAYSKRFAATFRGHAEIGASVGWVERSETHRSRAGALDGFRCALPIDEELCAVGRNRAIKPLPGRRPAKRSLLFSLISRLLSPEASSSRRGRLSGPARNLSYGKGSQTAGNRPVPVRTRVCALC